MNVSNNYINNNSPAQVPINTNELPSLNLGRANSGDTNSTGNHNMERYGVYHQQHKLPQDRLVSCQNCGQFFRNRLQSVYVPLCQAMHERHGMEIGKDCKCSVNAKNKCKATWDEHCKAANKQLASISEEALRGMLNRNPPRTRSWAPARWAACVKLGMRCHPGKCVAVGGLVE